MFRDVAVILDPRPGIDHRLAAAAALARAHGARLIGIDMTIATDREGPWSSQAAEMQDAFNAALSEAGIDGLYRGGAFGNGPPMGKFAAVDLLIASSWHGGGEDEGPRSVITERVILSSGVPVLVLPVGWTMPAIPDATVVLAWNASREATRAVHDALPLLRRAGKVVVFASSPDGGPAPPEATDRLVEHLAQHGIAVSTYTWPDLGDASPVELLFECLTAENADIVVAGAFGHKRWASSLSKGTTDAMLHHPLIPTFLSH